MQKSELFKHCDISKKTRQTQEQVLSTAADHLLKVRREKENRELIIFC